MPVLNSSVVKDIGQVVGKEALQTGSRILTKMAEGEPVKSAVLEEGKSGAESLLEKSLEGLKKSRLQTGKGIYKKRGNKRSKIISSQLSSLPISSLNVSRTPQTHAITTISPKFQIKKRKRSDAFGFY